MDIHLINYEEYKKDDFLCPIDNASISNNNLFKSLLNSINLNINDFILKLIARNHLNYEYIGVCNNELKTINDKFNDIFSFFNPNVRYHFKLEIPTHSNNIKSTTISLVLNIYLDTNNEDSIEQKYYQQSDGFKWFFNFFFNFYNLFNKESKSKQVILLDEPGIRFSNLSLINLRKFLKKLTFDYGITFVLTTHRSEWIDLDYLEELRIIKKPKTEVIVKNLFTFQDDKNDLYLMNLIKSVEANFDTIGINDEIDNFHYTKNYVLIEGITDYLYLTGIKIYLLNSKNEDDKDFLTKLKGIYFIPINGVGNKDQWQECIQKYNTYKNIFQQKKFLFVVDNDDAGKLFKLKNNFENESKYIKTIANITKNEEFTTIESLLDQKNITYFKLLDDKKHKNTNNSYEFKRAIIDASIDNNEKLVSQTTIDNLTNLIKGIVKELE